MLGPRAAGFWPLPEVSLGEDECTEGVLRLRIIRITLDLALRRWQYTAPLGGCNHAAQLLGATDANLTFFWNAVLGALQTQV